MSRLLRDRPLVALDGRLRFTLQLENVAQIVEGGCMLRAELDGLPIGLGRCDQIAFELKLVAARIEHVPWGRIGIHRRRSMGACATRPLQAGRALDRRAVLGSSSVTLNLGCGGRGCGGRGCGGRGRSGRWPKIGRPLGRAPVEIKQGPPEFDPAQRDAAMDAETEDEAASHHQRPRPDTRAGPARFDDRRREPRLVWRLGCIFAGRGGRRRSAGQSIRQP